MRRPGRLFRELTPAGAIAFQIFFAANVLAALIHPLFMAGLGVTLYALPTPWANTVIGERRADLRDAVFSPATPRRSCST